MVLNSCKIYYKMLYIILTVLEQKVYFSATGTTLKAHWMTSRGPVLNQWRIQELTLGGAWTLSTGG